MNSKLIIKSFSKQSSIILRKYLSTSSPLQNIKNYTPNNLEKRFLVWAGKYKSISEIPNHVSTEEMERCRNKVRIRVANIMIVATVLGCFAMVYSGKQAAKRGETVAKQNLDWHKKFNEEKPATN